MKYIERHSSSLLDDTEWNLLNSGLPNYYTHIVNLYERQKAYSYVIEFARLALQFAHSRGDSGASVKTEMLSRLFIASTAISHFDVAHSTLLLMENEALQKSYLRKLVEKMCETSQNAELVALPFPGLQGRVDEILLEKCMATKDVTRGIPYHQILYAWRISRNDYRGGAVILLDRLQKLQRSGEGDKLGGEDGLDTAVTRQYLVLLNTLSCADPNYAWIIEEPCDDKAKEGGNKEEKREPDGEPTSRTRGANKREGLNKLLAAISDAEPQGGEDQTSQKLSMEKLEEAIAKYATKEEPSRKLVTLESIRKQYQNELDRIVSIQNNQFEFGVEDDLMDQV
jgi:nuclear pore complex protein Nup160